jgi:hypothetical protein
MILDPTYTAPISVPSSPASPRWSARVCARLSFLCELLRGTHDARIPF